MALPPTRDHAITLDAAAALTRRYRAKAGPGAQRASMFPREVFTALLAQPGCVGVRIYNGLAEGGETQTVLVGVDAEGNNMESGLLFDWSAPCPPYCGGGGGLNGE